ncbi:MAG TPA: GTP cyclohydrolase I FolE2 [Candidatus Coatesbacteria bacterium]|nr:GTP cyclohydrolase I FolE2 [Candidatus Coatesbacteria bacterium]
MRPHLPDVANDEPAFELPLDKVGVKHILYPVTVLDQHDRWQSTVARVNMYVDLPQKFRGTHMSRFIAILNRFRGRISFETIRQIVKATRKEFQARSAHLELRFPYFIEKKAPVSGEPSLMEYRAGFHAFIHDEKFDIQLEVSVPVMSLCPCSKEISDRGAHNQRSVVRMRIKTGNRLVWIEELVEIAEDAASSPLYALLKREDEKAVTEAAYDNPRFVEDIVRYVAQALSADPRIQGYRVECENFESIHNHSAYAAISKGF